MGFGTPQLFHGRAMGRQEVAMESQVERKVRALSQKPGVSQEGEDAKTGQVRRTCD